MNRDDYYDEDDAPKFKWFIELGWLFKWFYKVITKRRRL